MSSQDVGIQKDEMAGAKDFTTFIREKVKTDAAPASLPSKIKKDQYEVVMGKIQYGAATWESIGNCLSELRSEWRRSGTHETDIRIYDDFLCDLKRRGLWKQA